MNADDKYISRTGAVIDSLYKLDKLRSDGTVTENEFRRLKAELMDQPVPAPKEIPLADKSNIRGFADTLFGSFVPEMRSSDEKALSSAREKYDFSRSTGTERRSSQENRVSVTDLIGNINNSLNIMGPSAVSYKNAPSAPPLYEKNPAEEIRAEDILSGIDFSLGENAPPAAPIYEKKPKSTGFFDELLSETNITADSGRASSVPLYEKKPAEKYTEHRDTAPAPAGIIRDTPATSDDILAGIDFSLDSPDEPVPVIVEDMTADIDFSLDNSAPADISQNTFAPPPKNASPYSFTENAIEKFMPMCGLYESRNSALINTESLGSLCIMPIFIVGAAAAVFFYYILVSLADITESIETFLLLFCFWAGVAPSCVIIPNSVKTIREKKKASEADSKLREYYASSGYTEIPYELTDPYILEFLFDGAENGSLEELRVSAAALMRALTPENIAKEKKQADIAPDDTDAARAASMYVLGMRMTSDN